MLAKAGGVYVGGGGGWGVGGGESVMSDNSSFLSERDFTLFPFVYFAQILLLAVRLIVQYNICLSLFFVVNSIHYSMSLGSCYTGSGSRLRLRIIKIL